MISIREEITIASPPEAVWPLLSDPAVVASCIPGATLTKAGGNGAYQGTMRSIVFLCGLHQTDSVPGFADRASVAGWSAGN